MPATRRLPPGLREYLHFEAEQMAKIQAGIAAAGRGEFASDAEVNAFFAKYGEQG